MDEDSPDQRWEDEIEAQPRYDLPRPLAANDTPALLLLRQGWLPRTVLARTTAPTLVNKQASNDEERLTRLNYLCWGPNRSRVACVVEKDKRLSSRCTYEAFVSFFSERDIQFKRVVIPSACPEWARGWYLWWQVGSYTSRFPSDWPLECSADDDVERAKDLGFL
jgi:hypothetical protein